ncbi:MAG: hypothetical protein EZS28_044576 [Streblomastix strix]|uniref:Uncharacterized protein n=1 Tax=Streblomastix strix TaxID=222440 RepID=A0A5J4TNW4_9EUKA|nr:MAG: hypothetical protein EZS28_044576 [Streblomastix strix]
MTKPHKVREIKNFSFRAFTINAKKVIDQNGGAQLAMATKQQIMASFFLSTLIVTIHLLISSTVFLASNTVLSGIIQTLKFESKCDGANYDTSVYKALKV